MKLLCLGAKSYGNRPVIVEELGYKSCKRSDIIEVRDMTFAEIILNKYPGCFELWFDEEKEKQNIKDKMLPKQKGSK